MGEQETTDTGKLSHAITFMELVREARVLEHSPQAQSSPRVSSDSYSKEDIRHFSISIPEYQGMSYSEIISELKKVEKIRAALKYSGGKVLPPEPEPPEGKKPEITLKKQRETSVELVRPSRSAGARRVKQGAKPPEPKAKSPKPHVPAPGPSQKPARQVQGPESSKTELSAGEKKMQITPPISVKVISPKGKPKQAGAPVPKEEAKPLPRILQKQEPGPKQAPQPKGRQEPRQPAQKGKGILGGILGRLRRKPKKEPRQEPTKEPGSPGPGQMPLLKPEPKLARRRLEPEPAKAALEAPQKQEPERQGAKPPEPKAKSPEPRVQTPGPQASPTDKKATILERIADTKRKIEEIDKKEKPRDIKDIDMKELEKLGEYWKERHKKKGTSDPLGRLREYRKKKQEGE